MKVFRTQHPFGEAALPEAAVLVHGEPVPRRKWEHEAVGVEGAHRGYGIPVTLCVCTDRRHGGPSSITARIASW